MNIENYFPLSDLSQYYNVERSFFIDLSHAGLIEILIVDDIDYVAAEKINEVEKIVRMYHDLEVNIEGIDVVLNLLRKIEEMQIELTAAKNRLRLYEL